MRRSSKLFGQSTIRAVASAAAGIVGLGKTDGIRSGFGSNTGAAYVFSIPEPAGLTLLSAAAILTMRRRQRLPTRMLLIMRCLTVIAALASVKGETPALAAGEFQGLGVLPGGIYESRGLAVSADGTAVAGESSNADNGREAFRWTASGGMIGLGVPANTSSTAAHGASADASVVVGYSTASGSEAFRWTQQSGMIGLGHLVPTHPISAAYGVSSDGSIVVGESRLPGGIGFVTLYEAFRWTESGGMTGLGFLPAHGSSSASAVSADGGVIVGSSRPADATSPGEAFRWTSAGGMVGLGHLGGIYVTSGAAGISADGAVIVGTASNDPAQGGPRRQAFRWTQSTGMVGLGHLLPAHDNSFANDASADGSIIVGRSALGLSAGSAFIWDDAHGMRNLQELLINEFGAATSLTGWHLFEAVAISDDGRVIVGTGLNPLGEREAWVAIVPEPATALLVPGALLALSTSRRRR